MTPLELADAQRAAVAARADRLARLLVRLWGDAVVPYAAPGSWATVAAQAAAAFTAAQTSAAALADGYTGRALAAQDPQAAAAALAEAPRLVPGVFGGWTASGMDVTALLALPAAKVEAAYAAGAPADVALAAGGRSLALYARTEVADAARDAVRVASVAHGAAGMVRVAHVPCCGRCAVLAGRWYRYSQGFERHPGDLCGMIPAFKRGAVDVPGPDELAAGGHIHDLTKAEAAAVKAGADLAQVVNAREGMYVIGGKSYTRSGTTRRGWAGHVMGAQRGRAAVRPSVTSIMAEATDRADALRRLEAAGYVVPRRSARASTAA